MTSRHRSRRRDDLKPVTGQYRRNQEGEKGEKKLAVVRCRIFD